MVSSPIPQGGPPRSGIIVGVALPHEVKMNLSRAAKKFRQSEPKNPKSPTPTPQTKKKAAEPPKPVEQGEPVVVVEPPKPVVVEPVAPEVDKTPKPLPHPKRPRFVRAQTEKRQRVNLPPLVSSNKPAARVLTKHLYLLPKEPKVR